MAAYDWSTPHGALVVAIATTTGALAANGQSIADAIALAGASYAVRWAAVSGVDAAKTSWLASAEAAWNDADEVARAILDAAGGTPLTPLSFDAYDPTALAQRVGDAQGEASTATLRSAAQAAYATLSTLWDPDRPFPAGDAFDAYLAAELYGSTYPAGMRGRKRYDSIRRQELELDELVQQGIAWTDAVTP